jgi:hypothetical protein
MLSGARGDPGILRQNGGSLRDPTVGGIDLPTEYASNALFLSGEGRQGRFGRAHGPLETTSGPGEYRGALVRVGPEGGLSSRPPFRERGKPGRDSLSIEPILEGSIRDGKGLAAASTSDPLDQIGRNRFQIALQDFRGPFRTNIHGSFVGDVPVGVDPAQPAAGTHQGLRHALKLLEHLLETTALLGYLHRVPAREAA